MAAAVLAASRVRAKIKVLGGIEVFPDARSR